MFWESVVVPSAWPVPRSVGEVVSLQWVRHWPPYSHWSLLWHSHTPVGVNNVDQFRRKRERGLYAQYANIISLLKILIIVHINQITIMMKQQLKKFD